MSSEIEKLLKLLAQTDSRDKVYKIFSGLARMMIWWASRRGDKMSAKNWSSLARSITEGRSLMRLGSWLSGGNKLIRHFDGRMGGWRHLLEFVRDLGSMGYVLGDNTAYLGKYKLISANPVLASKGSRIFQFWGYVCALLLDVWALLDLQCASSRCGGSTTPTHTSTSSSTSASAPPSRVTNTAIHTQRHKLMLSLVKNLCDVLVVLPIVGYLGRYYRPHTVFTALCVITSGVLATHTNWHKLH